MKNSEDRFSQGAGLKICSLFLVRPAWAHSCGCKSHRELITANEAKRNCGRVTDRGEEVCECVRKYRPDIAAGHILVKAARLRTETSYKAGSGRRVCTTSQSRSQTLGLVNDELAQRSITLLSGETCRGGMRVVAAPTSKACLKTRNVSAKADAGAAGVRNVSTSLRHLHDEISVAHTVLDG